MSNRKHEFALYCVDLSSITPVKVDDTFYLDDEHLYHRINRVLRLQITDVVTLFDRKVHARCQLQAFQGKRRTVFQLQEKQNNVELSSHITFFLPLLKRDDFESALYVLAELGVNDIQLLTTSKVSRTWGKKRERERLERIIIAAAEQSKHFAFPIVHDPISFDQLLTRNAQMSAIKVYFDPSGKSLLTMLEAVQRERPDKIELMVGPEGDLTSDEKVMLQRSGFVFCSLTPTILRANHAVTVGAGAFRTLVFESSNFK